VNCYYCDKPLNNDRVRDHDHLTGKYRGAAHNWCNLQARKDKFVPVFFHNLSHYDAHLFIKQLTTKLEERQVKLLAKSSEDYISFQFGCLRFLDSFRFLSGSLDNITKSMTDKDFKLTRLFYPDDDKFKLLRKKGSVPYSFYTSFETFNETTLTHDMFYNDLKNEMEPESVYKQAKEIWDHFNIQNHGQFLDLYLKTDVLLLADLFERFRSVNIKHFNIDPCHCYSAPGLTWQAGLKYTNINLELLTEIDTLLFFEKAIRGGVSGIMGDRYFKPDKDHKLLYVDANNLYGWAMMEPHPMGMFKTTIPENLDLKDFKNRVLSIDDNSPIGYYFEVDLKYPDHIKFKTKNMPYCPEQIIVPDEWLSDYQRSRKPTTPPTQKLLLTQNNKKKYILHYRLLKFYLQQEMVLEKVHKIVSFQQSNWLRPYIDFNTKQRTVAETAFEKDFFKLMNNSYYGKTCEDIRKRKNVYLISKNTGRSRDLHNKPNFENNKIISEDLEVVMLKRTSFKFNKPIYIGATVLELSKLLMYEFYYNVLQPHFGEKNMELLYMDTDSFILKIKTQDLTNDLNDLKEHFDFSNYPKDHKLYSAANTKVPGKFKVELGGDEMTEFIALRSKMYAYKTAKSESKKLKGIAKNVVKKCITFQDYKNCLFQNLYYKHKMRTLKSKDHEMYVQEIFKKSLTPFDDKRYIFDNGIETIPHGFESLYFI
jgi:hypothetical protein